MNAQRLRAISDYNKVASTKAYEGSSRARQVIV